MIYKDNRGLIPSSANVTLYTPSGSVLEAQTAASVAATTGEMTYALTTTHTASKDLNYKASWDYVISGTTYYEDQLFDVVLSILSIPATDDDLYDELNSLREAQVQDNGTATAGAADSLTDTANRKEPDDYWTGGTIEILSGTGIGQIRDVSDFVQSTSVLSISPNWTTNPSTDSTYRIIRSWTNQIKQGFEKIETMLLNRSSEIKIPLIYLTVHHIALDLMDEVDDKWSRLAELYWTKFENAFSTMKLQYDEDESGTITGEEEGFGMTSFTIGRA